MTTLSTASQQAFHLLNMFVTTTTHLGEHYLSVCPALTMLENKQDSACES